MFRTLIVVSMRKEIAPSKKQTYATFEFLFFKSIAKCLTHFICLCSSMVANVWFKCSPFIVTSYKDLKLDL